MIDILLATFNGEKYLRQQIDSILMQSYTDWNLIISDDGSTDHTRDIISEYTTRFPGKITLICNPYNTGSALYNFWNLLQKSTQDYCMFCDQDDIWLKDKVEHAFTAMQATESKHGKIPILVHTDLKVIDQNGKTISDSLYQMQNIDASKFNDFKQLLCQNAITGCTMMINKPLKEILGPISSDVIMHDWWIALHAAYFGHIEYIPYADILYRQHETNVIGAKNVRSLNYLSNRLNNVSLIKKNISATYQQALAFWTYVSNLEIPDRRKCKQVSVYASLPNFSKFKRIAYLFKYGFWKQSLIRRIGQIFFC